MFTQKKDIVRTENLCRKRGDVVLFSYTPCVLKIHTVCTFSTRRMYEVCTKRF